jgi:hypothetical protein
MILFSDIFNRAIVLFDDPDINSAYLNDPVAFQKIMLPYLLNGKNKFSSPLEVTSFLVNYTPLESAIDELAGNGTAIVIVEPEFNPPENSVFSFKINGVADPGAIYNSETKEITFSTPVEIGEKCSIEYCYAGAFTDTIKWSYSSNRLTSASINERVIDILAHCTLLAWCEREQNFILDIRNLLTDTDFRLYSPANSVKAKIDWYKAIKEGLDDLTGKLGWDMRGTRKGGF